MTSLAIRFPAGRNILDPLAVRQQHRQQLTREE